MNLGPMNIDGPGDWALGISKALGASEYVNPSGGIKIFDPEKFMKAGIKLTIRNIPHLVYACPGYEFGRSLSALQRRAPLTRFHGQAYLDAAKQDQGSFAGSLPQLQ